jgi:hypothetical protein
MPSGNGDSKSDAEYEDTYEETMRNNIVNNLRKKWFLNAYKQAISSN